MSWVKLFEQDVLPADVSREMAAALDRRWAGKKMSPKGLRRARQALSRIEASHYSSDLIDDERAAALKEKNGARNRTTPSGATGAGGTPSSAARPGPATSVSTGSRHPVAGSHVELPATGGALATRTTAVDARRLSDRDYVALLQAHGLDASFFESRNSPPPPLPSAAVGLAQHALQRRAAKAQQERAARIEAGRIDASQEKDPAKVANRVAELLGPYADPLVISEGFRPPPEPLKPLDQRPDPFQANLEARQKAERAARRLAAASKRGKPADAKTMAPDVFESYLKARGYWAGGIL